MSELGHESKALFGSARAALEPEAADRVRVGRALGRRLGIAALTASGSVSAGALGATAGVAAPAVSTLAVAGKWLGIGVLVGLGTASGYVAVTGAGSAVRAPTVSSATPRPMQSAAPVLGALPPVVSTASSAPAPAVAEPAKARALPEPRESAAPAPTGHVAEEAALLRRADEALRGGDPNRALALLREHAVRFADGILVEERSAELVSTLCRLGRVDEARREGERFLRTTPDSPLAASVRSSCIAREGKAR